MIKIIEKLKYKTLSETNHLLNDEQFSDDEINQVFMLKHLLRFIILIKMIKYTSKEYFKHQQLNFMMLWSKDDN